MQESKAEAGVQSMVGLVARDTDIRLGQLIRRGGWHWNHGIFLVDDVYYIHRQS